MSTKQIVIAYAWDQGESHGPIFGTVQEALSAPAPRLVTQRIRLLKLYIDEQGKVVHTEEEEVPE